ncbi:hypothetical protein MHYP_G00159570 [Metynnis hypsauchen]
MDKSQEKICHVPDAIPEKGPHEDGIGSKRKTEEKSLNYKEGINRAAGIAWRFPLIEMQGVPLRNYIVQKWSTISAFCPDPSDMLIATYPKAGTTWTQEIVDLLLHNGDEEACKRASTSDRFPFLEIQYPPPIPSGLDLLKNMKPPRVIKTHLPIQLVPKGFWENKCKVIYVARNAKDNLVSYYHFDRMNQAQPQPGPWEEYIQKFMRGKVAWGSWYDHVKGYWKEREKKNILYLFFEDLKKGRLETGQTISLQLNPKCLMRTTPDKWQTWTFPFAPAYKHLPHQEPVKAAPQQAWEHLWNCDPSEHGHTEDTTSCIHITICFQMTTFLFAPEYEDLLLQEPVKIPQQAPKQFWNCDPSEHGHTEEGRNLFKRFLSH